MVLLLLCTASCSYKKEKPEDGALTKIQVNLKQYDMVSFYDIFDDVDIINLETTENSLIKNITKIRVLNDTIFLLDHSHNGRLLMFDTQGKFIKKVGEQGGVPNEYIDLADFLVDVKNHRLFLLSGVGNCMFEYSLDGYFNRKIKLPLLESGAYGEMTLVNDDTLAFWTSHIYHIKYYSISQNKILNEGFHDTEKDVFSEYIFPADNYYCGALTNTVYSFNNGEFQTSFSWDFGKDNNKAIKLPNFNDRKTIIEFGEKVFNSEIVNYVIILQGINSNYYYAQLCIKKETYNLFYDRKNQKTLYFKKTTEGAMMHPIF